MDIKVNISSNEDGPVAYLFLDSGGGIPCKNWNEVGRIVKKFKKLCKKEKDSPSTEVE